MDFTLVLNSLLPKLRKAKVRYAVTGGVAVGFHAEPRATKDLDLLVHRDDVAKVHEILARMGYERFQLAHMFSRYDNALEPLGDVDVQHATTVGLVAILKRARRVSQSGIRQRVAIVQPEDLIGLKALGMANNPKRRRKDWSDMLTIAKASGRKLKWKVVRMHLEDLQKAAWWPKLKREARS